MKTTICLYYNEHEVLEFTRTARPAERDRAREWLHQQYQQYECAPKNPVGKILMLDVIYQVAECIGKKAFAEKTLQETAETFLQSTVNVLDRPQITIDFSTQTIH